MALASAAGALLKPQTPLQQLLEDINFQRTKEMRQLLKDDGGFVVLQGTTYWTDLFVRHFLFQTEPVHSIDSDDLLFFVRKKHVKSSSRHMPKYETEVEVFRKDSRKLPIGDPDVDWEETVYLNMVIHQFDYTLTLAICTRTSPKELQVLRRHSQRVYASPSRRKMDTKGEGEEITYPHICFMVDNFDEVFSDILVRDGEMVCVELVANDKDGAVQGVIFLGSIRYDALKKVYDARQSSLSSKVAQRMSFGLFSSGAGVQTRCEFVRMKGPQGKGHAEMAVTKPKGSGVETPTSEPGFCATDMWDEWEEENDDYCTYRHQRRLSDPSANLNNFSRYGWRTKNTNQDMVSSGTSASAGAKARSENEGLDTLANEVSEIEAGDLRDDQQRPAFSASAAKLHPNPNCETLKLAAGEPDQTPLATNSDPVVTQAGESTASAVTAVTPPPLSAAVEVTVGSAGSGDDVGNSSTGCNCFGGGKKCKKRWTSSANSANDTPEMSEIYCPSCEDAANETPACLSKMPDKRQTRLKPKPPSILCVESELVVAKRGSLRLSDGKRKGNNITRSVSLSAADRRTSVPMPRKVTPTRVRLVKTKELDKGKDKDKENDKKSSNQKTNSASNLLAKMSPKRLRNAKASDKEKEKSKDKDKSKISVKSKTGSSNNNHVKATTAPSKTEEYEIADDATSLNGDSLDAGTCAAAGSAKIAILSESDSKLMISVRGREELPVVEEQAPTPSPSPPVMAPAQHFVKCLRVPVKSESHPLQLSSDSANNDNIVEPESEPEPELEQQPLLNGEADAANGNQTAASSATLPRTAKQSYYNKVLHLVPKRRTPDGTNIYYWCDLPKKALKELDDGAYNPLWTSRGFTQSFHFWKENRRQQSTPLNAFLTYVTLPWWSIAKDLLDHRETPILTF
ncbi:uncharacterized protein [Drosophila virilis]|uniref:Uncharacterized protein, isoform A n=1 Tax=Drosophila virilis TaxID=7244 RepID=B4LJD0_DROVI|nr:uncharacterized protein LOC6626492 isoform X1 [Drosophila virilis]XP_015029478.1 uncharacterized protein LOC6626492 isoform X1 [Drosophila virilis]EDW60510.1 uncharacterized protein Dvir_GJ20819, isoform A [Drosophila virilis]KRF79450.1 uncharacterized protein Dvir_GJ20819, isoform B [Drosophila virilis]